MLGNTDFFIIDTNLLVQCRALTEVNWRDVSDAQVITLIISRPVQSEIDDHKNNGGNRVAKRARKASSLIREIILSDDDQTVIRDSNPRVTIAVDPATRPAQRLSEELDYSHSDDQLVGITAAYQDHEVQAQVFLLSHDTGPMASAKAVGIPIKPIPDEWLLPPEPSVSDRKLRALEAEVEKLKNQEPRFLVECVDIEQALVTELNFEIKRYPALEETEISDVIDALKNHFPLITDFGSRERAEREPSGMRTFLSLKEVYEPVTDEEIDNYSTKYDEWIEACDSFLRSFHRRLNQRYGTPQFLFQITNIGNRPANDALVTFEARGAFKIMPPPYKDNDDKEEHANREIALPAKPKAPHGAWRPVTVGNFAAIHNLTKFERFANLGLAKPSPYAHIPLNIHNGKRDPNGFFYKPDRPIIPTSEFSLECEQWRHGIAPEEFKVDLHFDDSNTQIAGAIECQIHAENISSPVKELAPVKIDISQGDTKAYAESLIREL